MSDRTDLDDCGADLHRWWNEIGRAEMEQDERINKRATMWECPYCGRWCGTTRPASVARKTIPKR